MTHLLAWYWWMLLGAAVTIGGTYWLTGSLAAIKPKAPESCTWCSRASGHTVTGHSYETCHAPVSAQANEERRVAVLQYTKQRQEDKATAAAANRASEIARQKARLRVLQIGTLTTRTGRGGNEIRVEGWHFDRSAGNSAAYNTTGAPEAVHGWTLAELHAIAHGGACKCDVVRLAKHTRR